MTQAFDMHSNCLSSEVAKATWWEIVEMTPEQISKLSASDISRLPSSQAESVSSIARVVVALAVDVLSGEEGASYFDTLRAKYPDVCNCGIDVRYLREVGLSSSNGMDVEAREQLQKQRAWNVVYEAAVGICESFSLVIVLCESGRYKSLSIAFHIAEKIKCLLFCHHAPSEDAAKRTCLIPQVVTHPNQLMEELPPRLELHSRLFGQQPHPLLGVAECRSPFNAYEEVKKAGRADLLTNPNVDPFRSCSESDMLVAFAKNNGHLYGTLIGNHWISQVLARHRWLPEKCVALHLC